MGLLELLWRLAAHRQRRMQQSVAADSTELSTADQSQQKQLGTSQPGQKTAGQGEAAKGTTPHCRLCFETEEEAPLVSPGCACRGSVEHIHLECLQNWQRTLAEQGLFSRALCCEICKQPYAPAFATFPADPKSLPPTFRQRIRELVLRTARSPELVFKLWRLSVLASGLVVGARQGAVGAGVGLCLGLKLATPVASFVFKVAPEVGLLAACIPTCKPALKFALCGVVSALTVEVLLASTAGLLCGGVVGFARGSASVLRVSADLCSKVAEVALVLMGGAGGMALTSRSMGGFGAARAARAMGAELFFGGIGAGTAVAGGPVAGRRSTAHAVLQALGHTACGAGLWAWQHCARAALMGL